MADMGVCNEDAARSNVQADALDDDLDFIIELAEGVRAGVDADQGFYNNGNAARVMALPEAYQACVRFVACSEFLTLLEYLRALQQAQSSPPSCTGNEARPETTGPDTKSPDPRDAYIEELRGALEEVQRDLKHVAKALAVEPRTAKAIVEAMQVGVDHALAMAERGA